MENINKGSAATLLGNCTSDEFVGRKVDLVDLDAREAFLESRQHFFCVNLGQCAVESQYPSLGDRSLVRSSIDRFCAKARI